MKIRKKGSKIEIPTTTFVKIAFAILILFPLNPIYSQQMRFQNNEDRIESDLGENPLLYWGTFYSGSGWLDWNDGYDIVTDNNLNVYVVGETESPDNITTPGSFQPIYGGGDCDGYLLKFDRAGNRIWATYYGGASSDYIYGIKIDHEGNIIVVGGTSSGNNIATPGAYQIAVKNDGDGFIAKFDSNGNRLWGTYLGGSYWDYLLSIDIDGNNNIIVGGETRSTSGLVTPHCFQPIYGGSQFGDTFFAKFNKYGQMKFCSYYGGESGDDLGAINTDQNNNIYISGATESYQNIGTSGTQQPGFISYYARDGFIAKFDSNGQRIWGTYVGGFMDDIVSGICCDTIGNVYAVGATQSGENIATPNQFKISREADEGYVIKYNNNGVRIWGSYYGGELSDGISDAVLIGDKLVLSGGTNSTSNISTSLAHQPTWYPGYLWNGTGYSDGFITCFDTTFNRLWGTYIGGPDHEVIPQIDIDRLKNIVYVGTTYRPSEYLVTPNCYQSQGYAMYNTFFGKFASDSTILNITYLNSQQIIKIFPNPASNTINIVLQGNKSINNTDTINSNDNLKTNHNCIFYNSRGNIIFPNLLCFDNNQMSFDISTLSPGLYMVKLFLTDRQIVTGKFVITR